MIDNIKINVYVYNKIGEQGHGSIKSYILYWSYLCNEFMSLIAVLMFLFPASKSFGQENYSFFCSTKMCLLEVPPTCLTNMVTICFVTVTQQLSKQP